MAKEIDYPHCWGKMDWVLEYPEGEEEHVCGRCEYGVKVCLSLTREKANVEKEKKEN